MKLYAGISFSAICLFSCSRPEIEEVRYDRGNIQNRIIQADLTDALVKGIEIPTARQTPSRYFKISFRVNGSPFKKYFYKIYYQNESYKFPENLDTTNQYNPLAEENFYGSWEDTTIGFKSISDMDVPVTDSIRITGNPRNEKKYFGEPFENSFYGEADILNQVQAIKGSKEWYASIVGKAKQNKLSVEEQLILDAKWVLRNHSESAETNNRWKRNPRMGTYSLMIVVSTEEDLAKIPKYIRYINQTSDTGNFVSPYYFFTNAKIRDSLLPHTEALIDSSFITVHASLDLASGIYANALEDPASGKIPTEGSCGWNKNLYLKAQFSQFFSTLAKDFQMNTIPLIKEVNDSSYTLEEYHQSLKKFPEKALKKDYIRNTESPCKYVRYNETKKAIEIINPGNENLAAAHKSNMGVKTRIGFTYGKITAKIKFPELLNKYNVWNGLTNAFWLLFQDEREWNQRRTCKSGYTAKGDNRNEAPRSPKTHYSEIDFELVKTTRHWPKEYYKANPDFREEDGQQSDNIIVGCTNWDLTCRDCRWYTVGLDTIRIASPPNPLSKGRGGGGRGDGGEVFETMRWDSWYQALTTRTPAQDDELFKSPYYYYQFEWAPGYITWRIGPEKNKLRVVAHMSSDITSIPNNQMIAVITQEYHLSEWWPPIPFRQEYIPFPKNDIVGEVYEITIE